MVINTNSFDLITYRQAYRSVPYYRIALFIHFMHADSKKCNAHRGNNYQNIYWGLDLDLIIIES